MKRIFCIVICFCLLFSLLPNVTLTAQADNTSKFEDVKASNWFASYVQYVADKGLMAGTSATRFTPNGEVTRAQFVQVLYALAGKPAVNGGTSFKDLKKDAYYVSAVQWAAKTSVTSGMTKTTFAPNQKVTREQAATFFKAYAEKVAKVDTSENVSLTGFPDARSTSSYAVKPMQWAAGAKLISGVKSGRKTLLAPKGTLTRAQLATMLKAFDQYLLSKSNKTNNVVDDKTIKEVKNGKFEKYKNGDIVFTPENSAVELIGASNTAYYNNLINVYTLTDLSKDDALELAKIVNGRIVGDINGVVNVIQLLISSSSMPELQKKAEQLMQNDNVLYASYDALESIEEDTITDPWALKGNKEKDLGNETNPGGNDWWAEAIKAYSAWEITDKITNTKPVDVGIVDSGFDLKHEDLQNTFIFPIEYSKNSSSEHGTHVAGLISANKNTVGLRGVSSDSKLVCVDYTPISIKILGKESNTYIDDAGKIEIIKLLIETNTKVINNSWGNPVFSNDYLDKSPEEYNKYLKDFEIRSVESAKNAIAVIASLLMNQAQNGNFLICQAAGNGYKKSKTPTPYDASLLSGFFCSITEENFNKLPPKTASKLKKNGINYQDIKEHVLIVGAVKNEKTSDGSYKAADFSSYGNVVDVYAPGNDIFSALPGNHYGLMKGTSMACPIVAGSVALLWKVNPSLTAKEVKSLLLNSGNSKAIENVTGNTKPMVDLYASVKMASNNPDNGDIEKDNPVIIDEDREKDNPVITDKDKVIKTASDSKAACLSVGSHHSAAIKKDGTLWMWGSNCYGELGSEPGSKTPKKIMEDVSSVSLGYYHSAAVKKDGSLWLWGLNDEGQVGDGSEAEQCTSKKVLNDTVKVSLGWNYSAAVKADGTLWMWGCNSSGQLGDGTTESRRKPVKIMNDVVDVSCARTVTAAVKKDGTLWIWGSGNYGELGLNETTRSCYKPQKLMDGVTSVSLSGGDSAGGHGAALKKDGSLWLWGSNFYGQLGKTGVGQYSSIPVKVLDNVAQFSLGFCHSGAVKKDGSLWLWGLNHIGQIGIGSCDYNADRFYSSPVKVMDDAAVIALGGDFSAAVMNDGSLWMWGRNGGSQLGDGTTDTRFYPKQIMAAGSICIQNDTD